MRLISARSVVRVHLGPPDTGEADRKLDDGERNAGAIAQLGERRPCTAEVSGSKPLSSTRSASRTFGRGDGREAVSAPEPSGLEMLFDNQARWVIGISKASSEGRIC